MFEVCRLIYAFGAHSPPKLWSIQTFKRGSLVPPQSPSWLSEAKQWVCFLNECENSGCIRRMRPSS